MNHLDVAMYKLNDSFHTWGFYAWESSVMRQLLPPLRPKKLEANVMRPAPRQLGLFES